MDKRTIFLIAFNIVLIVILILSRRKKKLSNYILYFATFIFTLTAVEFIYRAFKKPGAYFTGQLKTGFTKYDSLLGYSIDKTGSLSAVKQTRRKIIFKKTYTIIQDTTNLLPEYNHRIGFRNPATSKEIVFLGCSVTFGEGLEDSSTLPYKTGAITQLNTVNLGCSGYGIHQVYRLFLGKYPDKPNNQRIFVYSFLHDHILRANGMYQYNMLGPYYSIKDDSLIHAGPVSANVKWPENKYIHYATALGTFSFLKDKFSKIVARNRVKKLGESDYDRCFFMIKEMAKQIQQSGGKLIIIDWDRNRKNSNMLNRQLFDRFEKQLDSLSAMNVQIISVSSVFEMEDRRFFIPGDGHPAASANEKLANALAATIK